MDTKTPSVGSHSPWGGIDYVTEHHDGVCFVSTPSHGGVFVPEKVRRLLPEKFRGQAWYEEDCEWAIPAYFLAGFFVGGPNFGDDIEDVRAEARGVLERWYPEVLAEEVGV